MVYDVPMHAFKFNDDGFLHKQQNINGTLIHLQPKTRQSNPSMIQLLLLFQSAEQISNQEFTACIYCFVVNSQGDGFFFHFILCLNVSREITVARHYITLNYYSA